MCKIDVRYIEANISYVQNFLNIFKTYPLNYVYLNQRVS